MTLIYVTGRNEQQIREGMSLYHPPLPSYAVTEVGTKVYQVDTANGEFIEELGYIEKIRLLTPTWDIDKIKEELSQTRDLRLQEAHHQNDFKASFFIDNLSQARSVISKVRQVIGRLCSDADVTYSVDEMIGIGLLDIMPSKANKMEGLEYLRQRKGLSKEEIIYAGDSGNDISALTYGYRSILVANAIDEVRQETKKVGESNGVIDKIYFAEGKDGLNGCYASGIIEGLEHFGFL